MTVVDRCGGALWVKQPVEEHKSYSKCFRCGRRLRSEEAQERGYGKICWRKHLAETRQQLF